MSQRLSTVFIGRGRGRGKSLHAHGLDVGGWPTPSPRRRGAAAPSERGRPAVGRETITVVTKRQKPRSRAPGAGCWMGRFARARGPAKMTDETHPGVRLTSTIFWRKINGMNGMKQSDPITGQGRPLPRSDATSKAAPAVSCRRIAPNHYQCGFGGTLLSVLKACFSISSYSNFFLCWCGYCGWYSERGAAPALLELLFTPCPSSQPVDAEFARYVASIVDKNGGISLSSRPWRREAQNPCSESKRDKVSEKLAGKCFPP